ncbi:MAG: UDP-galactopyranose mutase [Proteobacteria bacterium]|nr:MAG: UDP-galactopyranose mutase [Pseudomonadota bacterium]
MKKKIAFAGAGFACAVIARKFAETGEYDITVYDERDHVAGNCHTYRDDQTQVMVHQYGPHIFNTSRQDVWDYVNQWSEFVPFVNRVKAHTPKGVFTLPVNLLTINQFFGTKMGPEEAKEFMANQGDRTIENPENFEEQALKFLGEDLYRNFFYGYTKKQWGVEPTELPASILKRLPVRFNYDDNYYIQTYQGIPKDGYTDIVQKILDHPSIKIILNKKLEARSSDQFDHVFWSGPMDGYFNYELGRLNYRTIEFEKFYHQGDYQGNPVINYTDESVPYTRIAEHKHFAPWETHEKTVCFKEFSKKCGVSDTPYYPMRLEEDKALLEKYVALAHTTKNVSFIGRLGTYRYLDMHVVIGESLDLAQACLASSSNTQNWPKFSASPM